MRALHSAETMQLQNENCYIIHHIGLIPNMEFTDITSAEFLVHLKWFMIQKSCSLVNLGPLLHSEEEIQTGS